MDIEPLLDAIKELPEEEQEHFAAVCHDIARRHPSEHFQEVGIAARKVLGIPEPEPEPAPEPVANDGGEGVTVGITGVSGSGKAGGLG